MKYVIMRTEKNILYKIFKLIDLINLFMRPTTTF